MLATVKLPPTRYFHVDLKVSRLYDLMTEICRLKAEAIQNHKNTNVHNNGEGKIQVRKWRFNFGCGQGYDGYVGKTVFVCRSNFSQKKSIKVQRGEV
jgi:hypothetical protein